MCIASFIYIGCYIVDLRSQPYQYNILGCSSIPCWVCRQKAYCIAFICIWSIIGRDMSSIFIFGSLFYTLFYSWFTTKVKFYVKLLFNWTCGLNNSSKQICLLRCFHLTLALLFLGTWWLPEGKGISCTAHPYSFRSLRAWTLIIWVHLL
jgi:hypothetical protein